MWIQNLVSTIPASATLLSKSFDLG